MQGRLKHFSYHLLISQTRGRIDREFVRQTFPEARGRVFFLCGPNPPAPDAAGTGFTLSFAASGKTVPVLEGETLLETATAAGVAIPSACRQGQAEVFVNDDDLCAASFSHVSATRPAM